MLLLFITTNATIIRPFFSLYVYLGLLRLFCLSMNSKAVNLPDTPDPCEHAAKFRDRFEPLGHRDF